MFYIVLQSEHNLKVTKLEVVLAIILMVLSTSIICVFGILHLVYTFLSSKLMPRDSSLQISMSQISPVITKETTMWRCWMGFNTTHSMSLILFGLVYGYLAWFHSQILFHSPFLLIVGLTMLVSLVVISKLYFFSSPFIGICIALACYIASILLYVMVADGNFRTLL
jgi:hypothetical protein